MRTFNATLLTAITLGMAVSAWTQQTRSGQVIQQARRYFYQAREGHFEVVPQAVSLLEDATAADPNNALLWRTLGTAYFLQVTAANQTAGADITQFLPIFRRAAAAFERAVTIEPGNAEALAGHGMSLTILAGLDRKLELFPKGMAEMNRAVETDPASIPVRLLRAFTTANFPAQIRNTEALIEDLSVLIRVSEGRRPGDVLHILLGDVYVEAGQAAQARRQYELAGRTSSTTREQAQSRLAALEQGTVPPAAIQSLRSKLGTNCMMCHAK